MSDRKLLLADDSLTIQKVVNLTFADEGIDVVCASSGEAAMSKLSEFVPDLVLADVNMPGPNGYKICEIIRQREETKDVPVILLVGSFEPFDEAEFRRVGANDYLTKPFQSIRHLVTRVSELLEHESTPSSENDVDPDLLSGADADEDEDIDDLYRQSFTETLEIPQAEHPITHLGDPGMDDELIETQVVSPPDETDAGAFELSMPADVVEDNNYTEFSLVDEAVGEPELAELGETETLTHGPADEEDIVDISGSIPNEFASGFGHVYNDAETEADPKIHGEEGAEQTLEAVPGVTEPEGVPEAEFSSGEATAESASVSDAAEPLEIPESEAFAADAQMDQAILEPEPAGQTEESSYPAGSNAETAMPAERIENGNAYASATSSNGAEAQATPADTIGEAASEPVGAAPPVGEISPELIEAVANKVIERISDRVIRRIAWQVIPEIVESAARDYIERDKKI